MGVRIRGTQGGDIPEVNRVEGNYIGTDAAGILSMGNGIGVSIVDADRNVIGGTDPAQGM